MTVLFILACLLGSYLLGSFNGSIIFSKSRGQDIRNSGSKNAGMTNTLRVYGKKAAVFVFAFDLFKGVISAVLVTYLAGIFFGKESVVCEFAKYAASLGAVLGHNFPLYFGFRGGKGILTSWGVIMILDYRIAVVLIVVFLALVLLFRYVSLASVTVSALFPVLAIWFTWGEVSPAKPYYIALALLMAALAIYRHRANISRLIAGTESKLGKKKES
ncbi:MAG: glycerol-3-phosphate 1-O-acyltransferase PlsY [Clostridia bacterium]|nr:glycerol-3-phosphate 1-O-acyltransferase PlsY [Clostridia bacterium]